MTRYLLTPWQNSPEAAQLPKQAWKKRIFLALVLVFFFLGIFFRVYGVGARALWTDEAWVALAATQPTPLAALAAGKSTPPFYLLTVWAAAKWLGPNEGVLRLPSVLFGLGALLLFWPLVGRLLPPWQALTALALFSISHRLVYFSKELKQYSADVFFIVLLFWLVERQLARQGQGGWFTLTLLLAAGLGFSYPLVFALPVAFMVLWWELPEARRAVYLSGGAVALTFLGLYLTLLRGQIDPELLIYWQADFPDLSGVGAFCQWLGAAWLRFGRYFFPDWRVLPGAVLVVLGLLSAWQMGRRRLVWYFFGPLLLALAAAFVQRYPFMGRAGGVRLMMFAAPMIYLATAAGLGWLGQRLWSSAAGPETGAAEPTSAQGHLCRQDIQRLSLLGVFLLLVLFWLRPLFIWQENLWPTLNREEIVPLVRYLEEHRRPGDAIYLYYFSIDPFTFYYRGPWQEIIWGQSCHDCGLPVPASRLLQYQRLWLIFSHIETRAEAEQFISRLLGPGWTKELLVEQPGAYLFRYRPPWAKGNEAPAAVTPPTPRESPPGVAGSGMAYE